jgi:hypothetical protein
MKRLGLLLVLAGCSAPDQGARTPEPAPQPEAGGPEVPVQSRQVTNIADWSDIEKYSGQYIMIQGQFAVIEKAHAMVTLDSGLNVYIPHMALHGRDLPWYDYAGRRVWAAGLLHTYTRDIPGYQGPSLQLSEFGLVQ